MRRIFDNIISLAVVVIVLILVIPLHPWILDFLLDAFVHAVLYYDTETALTEVQKKMMSLLSDNYIAIYRRFAERVEKSEQAPSQKEAEKLYLRLLLVTDHVCGMTDSHAKRLYQELNGTD